MTDVSPKLLVLIIRETERRRNRYFRGNAGGETVVMLMNAQKSPNRLVLRRVKGKVFTLLIYVK